MDLPPGANAAEAGPEGISVRRDGAAGTIVLDRPQALNALTAAMRAAVAEAMPRWSRDPEVYAVTISSGNDRAFCAGGDVREMTQWGKTHIDRARAALAAEYRLCWQLDCFTKPTVALMDGIAMGAGVGLSHYGTHRVAGPGYRFAMPETGIGLFPDDGVCWLFARMPDAIGMYLALTGRAIGRADAYRLGLVTHCIEARHFDAIRAGLADAEPVDPLLDDRHQDPGPGELAPLAPAISRCFGADSVEGIIARLRDERGASADWAGEMLRLLARRSPTSLKITHRLVRMARTLDLRGTLALDYRLACHCLEGHDFHEGVRAQLIDRDRNPQWKPAHPEEVSDSLVEAHFALPASGELELQTRTEMQAFRR